MDVHSSSHLTRKLEAQRFCVSVSRLNYPLEPSAEGQSWIQPAHLITFVSPIVVINLLPCHLHYKIKNEAQTEVRPGSESCLSADISQQVEIVFSLETFPASATLTLSPGVSAFDTRLNFVDSYERILSLSVRVVSTLGGAIRVSVFSPFWLVNKTGLPLVFRQDGVSTDAPGQDEEHEVARMAAPLMFSFTNDAASSSETSNSFSLTMRIGTGLHPEGKAQFCRRFNLQPGSTVRRLRVAPKDSRRVDLVYIIGVDVRVGKGRYRNTHIVTSVSEVSTP